MKDLLEALSKKVSKEDYDIFYDKYVNTAKAMCKAFADNDIYLTHKYDKRGRVYCQGYYISYHGTDWNKAVLELSNKEIVNDF